MRQPFPNYRWVSRVDIDTINFLEQFCVRGEDEIRLTLQEAPTRETRSDNNTGTPCPTLSENRVGFFLTSPVNHVEQKLQETGDLVNSSLQLRLNSAIWSSQALKGTKKKVLDRDV